MTEVNHSTLTSKLNITPEIITHTLSPKQKNNRYEYQIR